MNYLEKARDLYNLVTQGKFLEAFEKYYDENVVMIEADGRSRKGKAENRKAQEDFLNMTKEFHSSGVNSITSNEKDGVTVVESWMDITFKDGRRNKMEEVTVQRWSGDKIVHERFYYNMAQPTEQQTQSSMSEVESHS